MMAIRTRSVRKSAFGVDNPKLIQPEYFLAGDHRAALRAIVSDELGRHPDAEFLTEAKGIFVDALLLAQENWDLDGRPAVLMDEEYGSAATHRAKSAGIVVAMPVERSGHPSFEFEYGDAFASHLEMFRPDYAKALITISSNAVLPEAVESDLRRLGELEDVCSKEGYGFMLEVLVSAHPEQLTRVHGDVRQFDEQLRAQTVIRAVEIFRDAGFDPDIWKLEGLESEADARAVADACTRNSFARVVLLGRAESDERVRGWIRNAAAVNGFAGFAIGRTIWSDAIIRFLRVGDRDRTVKEVAANYLSFAQDYERNFGALSSQA